MRRAFTLIELLVVIAIIAILAAILFPVFAQAKAAAKKTAALSQMKELATSTFIYAGDQDDFLPMASSRNGTSDDPKIWTEALQPYVKSEAIFTAPGTDAKYASSWSGTAAKNFTDSRKNQNIGYSDATGVDPASTAVPGAAAPGTEGFTSSANFSQLEESSRVGLFATTPNSAESGAKERGYVFNPYNGPDSPDVVYTKGLPLIADVNVIRTPYLGVNHTGKSPGALKPILALYGATGKGEGSTPVIFGDSHAKSYSARQMNGFGTIIWRFR